MTFDSVARSFTPAEFTAYFDALDFRRASWAPKMLTLHNTFDPDLATWMKAGATPAQRMVNLRHLYRDIDHWHSGPHWFVCPDRIWEMSDPLADGVHCSCANRVAFGVEMVGNYEAESFSTGLGAQVRDNAVHLVSTIFKRFVWTPDPVVFWERGLSFHRDCARDHHPCPGKNVDRADFGRRVTAAIAGAAPKVVATAQAGAASLGG